MNLKEALIVITALLMAWAVVSLVPHEPTVLLPVPESAPL